jgi:hypothetical protein
MDFEAEKDLSLARSRLAVEIAARLHPQSSSFKVARYQLPHGTAWHGGVHSASEFC